MHQVNASSDTMIRGRRATRRGLLVAGLGLAATVLPLRDAEASKKRNKRKKNKEQGQDERQRQDEQRGQDEPQRSPAPEATLAPMTTSAIGGGWTHVVGGGGSILFYNKHTGSALTGTLDGRGFTPVEEYSDFARGYEVIVGTPRGSVLFLRKAQPYEADGPAMAGTLRDGRWTVVNRYTGFAPWTDGEAAGDSVFLYNREKGHGASGTLVDGAWSYYQQYRNFHPDFTHMTATDDSLLFHQFNSRNAKAGTLKNGVWSFTNNYSDIGNAPHVIDYHVSVGAGDTILLLGYTSLNGVVGRLVDGVWRLDHNYPGFNYWTHAAHAGNGFVLLYDPDEYRSLAAWGALGGGEWRYYGTT